MVDILGLIRNLVTKANSPNSLDKFIGRQASIQWMGVNGMQQYVGTIEMKEEELTMDLVNKILYQHLGLTSGMFGDNISGFIERIGLNGAKLKMISLNIPNIDNVYLSIGGIIDSPLTKNLRIF